MALAMSSNVGMQYCGYAECAGQITVELNIEVTAEDMYGIRGELVSHCEKRKCVVIATTSTRTTFVNE